MRTLYRCISHGIFHQTWNILTFMILSFCHHHNNNDGLFYRSLSFLSCWENGQRDSFFCLAFSHWNGQVCIIQCPIYSTRSDVILSSKSSELADRPQAPVIWLVGDLRSPVLWLVDKLWDFWFDAVQPPAFRCRALNICKAQNTHVRILRHSWGVRSARSFPVSGVAQRRQAVTPQRTHAQKIKEMTDQPALTQSAQSVFLFVVLFRIHLHCNACKSCTSGFFFFIVNKKYFCTVLVITFQQKMTHLNTFYFCEDKWFKLDLGCTQQFCILSRGRLFPLYSFPAK